MLAVKFTNEGNRPKPDRTRPVTCIKQPATAVPVEVVHGVAGVAGDLVETLSSAHGLLYGVLVVQDLII